MDDMIGAYKDQHFRDTRPDPREIDPAQVRSIRERLEDKYYYQWRATRADTELISALLLRVRANKRRPIYALCRYNFLEQ